MTQEFIARRNACRDPIAAVTYAGGEFFCHEWRQTCDELGLLEMSGFLDTFVGLKSTDRQEVERIREELRMLADAFTSKACSGIGDDRKVAQFVHIAEALSQIIELLSKYEDPDISFSF